MMRVDRKCPCKGCERRLVGCHGICPDYGAWKRERDRITEENREISHELSRSMKRHIWRKMLGR